MSKRPRVSILDDLLLGTAQRSIHHNRSQLIYLDTPASAHQHAEHIVLFRQHKPWPANKRSTARPNASSQVLEVHFQSHPKRYLSEMNG